MQQNVWQDQSGLAVRTITGIRAFFRTKFYLFNAMQSKNRPRAHDVSQANQIDLREKMDKRSPLLEERGGGRRLAIKFVFRFFGISLFVACCIVGVARSQSVSFLFVFVHCDRFKIISRKVRQEPAS